MVVRLLKILIHNLFPPNEFQTGNKKDAERLVKNIIKIVIKIGILHRNNQFNAEETAIANRFHSKFQVIIRLKLKEINNVE